MTRHMSGEYISVSNGKRPVSNVKKRAKMFAVCAWMQIAVARQFQSLSIVFVCEVNTKLASRFGLAFSLQIYMELTGHHTVKDRHRIKIHTEGPLTSDALKFLSSRITHVGRHCSGQSMTFSGQQTRCTGWLLRLLASKLHIFA